MHRVFRRLERVCMTRRLNFLAQRPLEDLIAVRGSAAEHFRRRSAPAFFFTGRDLQGIRRRVSAEELERCLLAAEKFSSLTFEFRSRPPVTFHGAIDWRHLEADDPDWNADLHRLDWLVTLVLAGHLSGNAGFVRAADHWICVWAKSSRPGTEPWDDPFEVAQRAHTLCWLLFTGVHHPDFSGEAVEAILRVLFLSGIWVEGTLEYQTPNNHLLMEALRLAQLGLLFPEFPDADRRLRKGTRLLEREVLRQVSADGVHREHSSFYQRMTAEGLLEWLVLCRIMGMPLAGTVVDRIERMFHFLEGIKRPDEKFPLIGDGFRSDILLRHDLPEAWRTVWRRALPGPASAKLRTILLLAGAGDVEAGEKVWRPPLEVWKEGGYAVFRSGTFPEESTLLFDFGELGMEAAPGHGHADCLSLELSIRGKPLLVDPGACSWTSKLEWRRGFRGTRAHNTVVVDGADQSPLYGFFGAGPFARPTLRWVEANGPLKCIHASHDGYRRLPCPVVHRRVVLETGRDGWLVIDLLEGTGEHEIQMPWHFDPRLCLHLEEGAATVSRGASPEIRMVWRGTPELEPAIYRGSRQPFLGWVSWESGSLEPADVLILKAHAAAPCWVATALIPWNPDGGSPEFKAESVENGLAAFLETGSGRTSVFVAWSGKNGGRFGQWRTDCRFAAVREGAEPAILSYPAQAPNLVYNLKSLGGHEPPPPGCLPTGQ